MALIEEGFDHEWPRYLNHGNSDTDFLLRRAFYLCSGYASFCRCGQPSCFAEGLQTAGLRYCCPIMVHLSHPLRYLNTGS